MTKCFQATGFKAYKCTQQGAHYSGNGPTHAIFSKMIMVDNGKGMGMNAAASK